MSSQSQFQTLFAYHWHTTRRLLECAARLDEAGYTAQPGYGHGSIHDLLFHLLRTDRSWRLALETGQQTAGVRPDEFPDLQSLRVGFEREQSAWQVLLAGFSDQAIGSDIALVNWRGDSITLPLWRVLQHLVLHGMQHHAELARLLTARGQSPGDIDFIFFT